VIINFPPSHRSLAVEASGLTERIRHPGNQKVSQHARPDEANFIGGNWLTPDKADKADKADNERLDFPFFPCFAGIYDQGTIDHMITAILRIYCSTIQFWLEYTEM